MSNEINYVREFARELFCYLKESVYDLSDGCECSYCKPRCEFQLYSNIIPEIAKIVSAYSVTTRKGLRLKYKVYAFEPKREKCVYKLQLPHRLSQVYYSLGDYRMLFIITVISEVYLFRYFKSRRFVKDSLCFLYVEECCRCFVYIYENAIRKDIPNFISLFENLLIPVCKIASSKLNEVSSRDFIIEKSSNISTWTEIGYLFRSMSDTNLCLRYPSVYLFVDSIEEGELDKNVKQLSERYKNFFQKFSSDRERKRIFYFKNDPLLDIYINKLHALRDERLRANQNEDKPIALTIGKLIIDFQIKAVDHYKKAIQDNSKCEGQSDQSSQDQSTQDQSTQDQSTQDLLTQALKKDAAQRFARDLFFFLKTLFNLKENCKCNECLSSKKIPSVFTERMGATVFILSLTQRKFFRARVKTVVVKHYNPILTPEEEKKVWEEISSLSRGLMDEHKNGMAYVFSLISEAYLFQYMRLRLHVDSDPCIDYLKACRLCFKYVYENVLQKDKDFVHSLEMMVVDEANESSRLELLIKMENNLKYETVRLRNDRDKNRYKSKSKKSRKSKNLNLWYIMEELEPKFVTSYEFVDHLCYDETCNINRFIKNLSTKYILFQKSFITKHGGSSGLIMEYAPPNPENKKHIPTLVTTDIVNEQIFFENQTVNVILEHFVDNLLREPSGFHFEPFPRSPEVFAGDLFYILKKLFNLNYRCECEACQIHNNRCECETCQIHNNGRYPDQHTAYIAMKVFIISLSHRMRFRKLLIFQCIEFNKEPDRDRIILKIRSVFKEFEKKEKSCSILLSLCMISEMCLHMHVKQTTKVVCYIQESINYFLYFYHNIYDASFPEIVKALNLFVTAQKDLTSCQVLILEVFRCVLKNRDEVQFNWTWSYNSSKWMKISPFFMVCLPVLPLNEDQKKIEEIKFRLFKRYKKLHKKHARALSAPPFHSCVPLFVGECSREYECSNRKRRLSA